MRHTKKLLALTLVLVMVAAFAVPAFAFDYKDDADIDPKYKEAIDTLYEMNVMRGSTSGNFDPKYTLSRGQMAMLMFIVDSGGNRDAKLWADASNNFTDIDGWFYTNHIKWAYAQGIVGGVTPTLFRPTNQLTAIEALGFALGLIGYNRNTEGFFGADWKNKILVCLNQYDNLFLLNKLDHLMGNLGDYITREETAQLIYNMLFVQRVEYDEGKAWPADITVGAWYFDDFYAGSGILLANNFAVIDSGSTVAEGSIRLDASTLIKADAPLAFFGREVNYVQPTGDAAMVFLANTDTVAATTVGAVKADMEKKPADATWDWSVTPLKYAKNYKSCTDTEFEAIKDDNPVTLVLKGKKVQFVLAMEYKFGQVSLETDGKVTVTGGGVKVLDKVA
ncbi:MAG: S-layer homology domain-containing protein, partial [Oscillospiraceae bacterium]|nr:S-layer homology domain-containing protein [Oscillospiraceae bacterium]